MSRRKRRKWLGKIVRITDENCDDVGAIGKVIECDENMAVLQLRDEDCENWYYYGSFELVDGN